MAKIFQILRNAWALAAAGFLFLCGSCSPPRSSADKSPVEVTREFYQCYLELGMSGLPNQAQMDRIAPFLGRDLEKAILSAQEVQDLAVQTAPEEKPPWAEGDLFSSLFEGAQEFEIQSQVIKDSNAEIAVLLRNTENSPPIQWSDVVLLEREGNYWAITEIQFKGEWAFKPGASLRSSLNSN